MERGEGDNGEICPGELCKQINHHSDTCKHIGGIFYITIYNQCNNHQTSPSQMNKSNGGGNTVPKHIEVNVFVQYTIKLNGGRQHSSFEVEVCFVHNESPHQSSHQTPPPHRAAVWVSGMEWICDNTILNYKFQVFNVLGHNQMI